MYIYLRIAHDLAAGASAADLLVADVPVPFPLSVSVYEESESPLLMSLPDVPKVFVEVVFLEPTLAVATTLTISNCDFAPLAA